MIYLYLLFEQLTYISVVLNMCGKVCVEMS